MPDENDPNRQPEPIPYAIPEAKEDWRSERAKALGMIVFFACVAIGVVFLIGGASWPTVAVIVILAVLAIAFGHFISRMPG